MITEYSTKLYDGGSVCGMLKHLTMLQHLSYNQYVKIQGLSVWDYLGKFFVNIFNGCRDFFSLRLD